MQSRTLRTVHSIDWRCDCQDHMTDNSPLRNLYVHSGPPLSADGFWHWLRFKCPKMQTYRLSLCPAVEDDNRVRFDLEELRRRPVAVPTTGCVFLDTTVSDETHFSSILLRAHAVPPTQDLFVSTSVSWQHHDPDTSAWHRMMVVVEALMHRAKRTFVWKITGDSLRLRYGVLQQIVRVFVQKIYMGSLQSEEYDAWDRKPRLVVMVNDGVFLPVVDTSRPVTEAEMESAGLCFFRGQACGRQALELVKRVFLGETKKRIEDAFRQDRIRIHIPWALDIHDAAVPRAEPNGGALFHEMQALFRAVGCIRTPTPPPVTPDSDVDSNASTVSLYSHSDSDPQ